MGYFNRLSKRSDETLFMDDLEELLNKFKHFLWWRDYIQHGVPFKWFLIYGIPGTGKTS